MNVNRNSYARFAGPLRAGLLAVSARREDPGESTDPAADDLFVCFLTKRPPLRSLLGLSYRAFHSSSFGTNVSASAAMPFSMASFSRTVFLRTVKFFDISVNLAVVGTPQTYDAYSTFSNREDHSMKSVSDQEIRQNAPFLVIPPQIGKIASAVPSRLFDILKVNFVMRGICRAFGVIPLKNKHQIHPWPDYGEEYT